MNIIEALQSIDYKDVIARATWTFIQVFLATFLVAGESIINLLFAASWSELKAMVIATGLGATAAGLSAVKTVALESIRKLKESFDGKN